jgi:hypothetical protein
MIQACMATLVVGEIGGMGTLTSGLFSGLFLA